MTATTAHCLVFALAPGSALPAGHPTWGQLLESQRLGLRSGFALRILRVPPDVELPDLIAAAGEAGSAERAGHGSFPGSALLCDALIPGFHPGELWLGAYAVSGTRLDAAEDPRPPLHPVERLRIETIHTLDRLALNAIDNESCWFYPTDNGTYLSRQNDCRLTSLPGYLPEWPLESEPITFERSGLRLLWSLMADESALTCVGLTYRGRRIDWPLLDTEPSPTAEWTSFAVDGIAEHPFVRRETLTTDTALSVLIPAEP